MSESKRLLSLDVLRGITIAGMIFVNNPGSWSYVCTPLGHAAWHGLTPTDLIFPFFMFIMGVSTFLSLKKYNFTCTVPTLQKITKRVILIFLIGLGLGWFSLSLRTFNRLSSEELSFLPRLTQAVTNFENIRFFGVLQRLALSYGGAALIAILVEHKRIPYLIATVLFLYFLLLLFGHGFEFSPENIVSKIDRAILGDKHMYIDNGLRIDPEGLLGTIPSICHVLIGFCCGWALSKSKDKLEQMNKLFIIGCSLTFIGFLLSYICPINKKIWSPTFVLCGTGLAASFLALLIWIIDVKQKKKWCVFFESFGVNPLFIFVASGFFAILLGNILFSYNGEIISVKSFLFKICLQPYLGNYCASIAFATLFLAFNWVIGHFLYKKKIYIKI